MIPIIFALSIMFFPTSPGSLFANGTGVIKGISDWIQRYWQPTGPNVGWDLAYNGIEFLLIIGFTYFYTAVTFDPVETADNLKKQSIFIPGIRPGKSTAEYLDRVMTRITLVGAMFLAIITVVVPVVAGQLAFGQAASRNNGALYLGGTAVLIVVGVALDTMKQLETQLLMRQYKGIHQVRLVLFGAPGSGKGTQGPLLAERWSIPQISTGEILRDNVRHGTDLGVVAEGYMSAGELVPDDVIVNLIRRRLEESDARPGFILDGFPRTLEQAEALDQMLLKIGAPLDRVVYLRVSQDVLEDRLNGRWTCPCCGRVYSRAVPSSEAGYLRC